MKSHTAIVLIALGLLGGLTTASAQQWPARPIRAIVPLTAGSALDVVPRLVFEQVSAPLGESIIVENRPGASGTIGTRAVATAPADGYTLLVHSSAFTISPATIANAGYDPVKDFAAVAPLATLPNVLVTAPSKNIRTVQELVAAAKSRPITFGSIGVGSPIHLAWERFRMSAGFEAQHIPFRGAPEVLTEVMTGRIDVYYSPILPALELIRDGKLVPLAVSGARRASTLPDVPTTLEAGYAHSDYSFWIGVFAPAGTPTPLVERLNQLTNKALENPAMHAKLLKLGVEPMVMSSERFYQYVKDDVTSNAALANAIGLRPK